MLVLVLSLSLLFPSLTRAGDSYNDQLRLLDLELEMLSLRSQMLLHEEAAINARLHEATHEQNTDLERDLTQSDRGRYGVAPPTVLESDHLYIPDSEPLFPTMRPPWLQPVDPMIPMLPEDRARMHCLGPRDCYLNQTGRERF
jgi:hypothetical protein